MDKLFPLPVYTFLKIAIESGGGSVKGLKNVPPWLIKTILFEPLRWLELVMQKSKINRHEIERGPIFILGFYRSGTSYLHHFLTQDDRLGYHTNFQMIFPELMLSCEKWLSPFFEAIFRLFKIQDPVHRVPLSFKFPGEEDAAMTTSLNPRGAQWGYFFPTRMNEYFRRFVLFENIPDSELEKWKQAYILLLKKISLANRGKQLVLKSPPHTARIKLLLSLFPDAKFILIHRNPYEVYASNKRFWKVTQDIYAIGKTEAVDINKIILDTYSETMHRYLSEKQMVPSGQLIELPYEELVTRPLDSMRWIYETLNLCEFSYCEGKMRAFAERQKKFVIMEHKLPPEEKTMVSQKWEPFFRNWNYAIQ